MQKQDDLSVSMMGISFVVLPAASCRSAMRKRPMKA